MQASVLDVMPRKFAQARRSAGARTRKTSDPMPTARSAPSEAQPTMMASDLRGMLESGAA